MKKSRVLGIVLMIAALLMQVAYAATTQQTLNKIGDFDVQFSSITVDTNYDDINVNVQKKDGLTLQLEVGNLYPGASYKLDMGISNTGQIGAEIVGFDIQQSGTVTENSKGLYDMIRGYDTNGQEMSLNSYKDYLNQMYSGKQIRSNQSMNVLWNMGISKDLENLENEQMQYDITITFKQIQTETGGGDNGNNEGDNPNGNEIETPLPDIPPVVPIPIEPEPTPGGPVKEEETIPDEPKLEEQEDIADEDIPGGKLPQTGGIPAVFIYVLGAGLFGTGAFLCRKKK